MLHGEHHGAVPRISQVLKGSNSIRQANAGKCGPTQLHRWGTKTGSATGRAGHSTPAAGVASVLLSGLRAAISSEDRVRTPLVHQCHLVSHHCHNARLQASFLDPEDVITQQSSITKSRCNPPGIPPPMAPAKAARNGAHDDSKSETPNTKEKNGGAGAHSNGKLRRVASSTGSNLREVTNAGAIAGPTSAPSGAAASSEQQAVNPGVGHAPSLTSCPGALSNCFLLCNSSNGLPFLATSFTNTAEPTVSTHRPPSRTTSTSGFSPSLGASGSTRRPSHGARNCEDRARTSSRIQYGSTSTASGFRRMTLLSIFCTRFAAAASQRERSGKQIRRMLILRGNIRHGIWGFWVWTLEGAFFSWGFGGGHTPAQDAPDFTLGDIWVTGCKCYGVWCRREGPDRYNELW